MIRKKAARRQRNTRSSHLLAVTAALAAVVLVAPTAAATTSPSTASTETNAPTAQLRWLINASGRLPIPAAEQRDHLAPTLLNAIGGPDEFNATIAAYVPLALAHVTRRTPDLTEAVVDTAQSQLLTRVHTGNHGLVDGLHFLPYQPSPQSWSELDAQLHTLAPRVSFATSVIDPSKGCRVVHGVDEGRSRPLGSAFKLYVLGALGQAVATGKVSWDEQLAIHEQWKSLPSGVLQNKPAGTELTLRQYADYMISISDNTAADHLIHFLGRDAVQRQLTRFGHHDPTQDTPFLTTRELFALKGVGYPALADGYLALPQSLRTTLLGAIDRSPRSRMHTWKRPEKIDQLEWFASPADICRAFAGLWRQHANPALSPIGNALSINDGGIGLDRARFPTLWFKGGSEPGVMTINYLARTAGGRIVVSSVMLGDTHRAFDEKATMTRALALARGGLELAARGGAAPTARPATG